MKLPAESYGASKQNSPKFSFPQQAAGYKTKANKDSMDIRILSLIVIWLWFVPLGVQATDLQSIRATTESGRPVLLKPDGTWVYIQDQDPALQKNSQLIQYFKPKSATVLLKGKRVTYGLWYDRSKWVIDEVINNASAEYELTHIQGDRYVVIIPERITIPLETLKMAAIANAKKIAPDIEVIHEETRIVNEHKILCLKMNATIQGIPVSYVNYYYSGKVGAVQLMAYTGQNLFEEYKQDLFDLLNGFEIYSN